MAAHIFNCTIDAPDLTPAGVPEDLSYNDIETITEAFAEKILGLENFFAERDDDDCEDKSLLKTKIFLDPFEPPVKLGILFKRTETLSLNKQFVTLASNFCNQFIGKPPIPPP